MTLGLVLAAAAAIVLDVETSPVRDLRGSTCGPCLGYAGCLTEVSLYNDAFAVWAYGAGIKETEKALVDCGAKFIRQWGALEEWQRGMAGAGNRAHPKACFALWKKLGIRVLLTIENYGVLAGKSHEKRSSDIEDVKRVLSAYLDWITKNKFTEVVAGFEMGNEPYFGKDPEAYAARVEALIPVVLKAMPHAKIGIPIAEYRAGDPDLDVVRRRLGEKKMMAGGGEFEINRFNQWSGRFVTALSNQIDRVTHVIYHFYGGDAAYGCSASGFGRIANFAKIYPQLADKRVWITEWRERSDEDVRCHQMFASTLFKAHYMLSVLAQRNIDGINLHCLGSYSGGLNISMNCSSAGHPWKSGFYFQSDPLQGYNFYPDPEGAPGVRRYAMGPAAPLFRIYTDALASHPVILDHGTLGRQGARASCWSSAIFYESSNKQRTVLNRGGQWKDVPPVKGNVEWIAALNAEKTSLALLMVNTTAESRKLDLQLVNASFAGSPTRRSVVCAPELIYHYNVPGEAPLWTEDRRKSTAVLAGAQVAVSIDPDTVQTIVIPIRRGSR